MKKQLFFVITVFALAGLLFLTGCPNGDDPIGGPVDTTALSAKITEAEAENEATPVSLLGDGTDISLGTSCVTAGVKATFVAEIAAAKLARDAAISQFAVNSALTRLNTALATFIAAKQSGSANPVDKTALNAKIAEAESLKANTVTAAGSGEVAQGAYWVTQPVMNTFDQAITSAKNTRDAATTPIVVNTATSTLGLAITVFETARVTGTKTSGFTADELNELIDRANAAKAGVTVAENGDGVNPAKYWVSQANLTILDTAITNAQTAATSGTNIDSSYLTLVSAINSFETAKQLGSTPDRETLANAIRAADTAKAGVGKYASASLAPNGSKWATAAQWAPFDTAYNNALASLGNGDATKNQVDAATSALTTATNTFSSAVQSNGLGTKPMQNTLTINGFTPTSTFTNGTEIMVGLFPTAEMSIDSEPEIYGEGQILNGNVTIELYTDAGAWAESGSYFVGLIADTEPLPKYFISTSAVSFSTPNPVMQFSVFEKYVFSITVGEFLGEYAEIVFPNPSSSIKLDDLVFAMSGGEMNYAAFVAYMGFDLYKNKTLTQKFTGTDTVNINTVFYSEIPFMIGMDEPQGPDRGEQIGEITGTITLTDIPSPAPRVYIRAQGHDDNWDNWWNSDENEISGVTGTTATLNWSIPVYEMDRFVAGEVEFVLWVVPAGKDNGFQVKIPDPKTVNNAIANVGSLGTVSIASITLSGTINVTYGGNRVPRVEIYAYGYNDEDGSYINGNTSLSSPGPNASWSMTIQVPSTPTEINFSISGYTNDKEELFSEDYSLDPPITVSNQNETGIVINLGDMQ